MALNHKGDRTAVQPNARIDYGPLFGLAGYRLKIAYSVVVQTFNEMFSELDLAFGQYSVLLLIGLNSGLSQLTLAQATGLDGSTIVPITERFSRFGWIRRIRRRDDRRFYELHVTPAGQAILDKAYMLIQAHDRKLLELLTERERATLMDLLARIANDRLPTQVSPAGQAIKRQRAAVSRSKTVKRRKKHQNAVSTADVG